MSPWSLSAFYLRPTRLWILTTGRHGLRELVVRRVVFFPLLELPCRRLSGGSWISGKPRDHVRRELIVMRLPCLDSQFLLLELGPVTRWGLFLLRGVHPFHKVCSLWKALEDRFIYSDG